MVTWAPSWPPGGAGIAADDDVLATGYLQVDAHGVGVALVMAMLRPPHHDAGRGNAIEEALEL